MEHEKFTFRQRWFPNFDDADGLREKRCERNDMEYSYSDFPVIDFFGRWIRTAVVGGILIGTTLWGGCNMVGNNFEYSKGTRTGMINKFSEKRLIFKTYEGQMALEGITSSGNYAGANVWDFSLDNQSRHGENKNDLVNNIQNYIDSGTKVKVNYVQPLVTWPWRSGTNYLVQSVDPIKDKAESEK